MKEKVDEVVSAISRLQLGEEAGEFTKKAQELACVALQVFTGSLLTKALAIAQAIVEFEDELLSKKKK